MTASNANQPSLPTAIENLYSTFSRYKLRQRIEGYRDQFTVDEFNRTVQRVPLRQLSKQDLESYAFRAMTTLGSDLDYKYFLPRLMELSVTKLDLRWIAREVIFGKLSYATWQSWRPEEISAVDDFLRAFWWSVIQTSVPDEDADQALCAIGMATEDLSPFLRVWQTDTSTNAFQHFVQWMDFNIGTLVKRRLANAFWSEKPQRASQVIAWLCDPSTQTWLDNAFFNAVDVQLASDLSQVIQFLSAIPSEVK